MNKIFTLFLMAGVVVLSACKKDNNSKTGDITTPVNKVAPDGFNYSTTKNVSLNLTLQANNNAALAGVVVSVYAAGNTASNAAIFKGVTDKSGHLSATITVPSYYTQIVIDPAYVGLMRNATANINGTSVTATIGGSAGYSGDIVPDAINNNPDAATSNTKVNGFLGADYVFPGTYTSSTAYVTPTNQGRPAWLETTGDVIDASLLSYVNASLPEGTPVTTSHPSFLNGATHVINVTAKSDVWVTFVSEGAGYENTLAYYTYKTNNPPSQATGGTLLNGIDKITYIFPNASASGSGGGLKSGDKVKLGTFDAGTTIAFVLIQNAWTGSGVNTNATKFYSQDDFNPESTSALRQHCVMLYDDVHQVYLLGFEDQNRQNGGSDNDFNDLVIYATSNPVSGISNSNVAAVDKGGDSDGDGVPDILDAFPNDATKAFVTYYPSASTYATIAFEDNWPLKGDYDMNDLVVNYRYTFIENAQNQIVQMQGDFTPVASGASFHNGFGVQLPVAASAVSSVTGQQTISNYITFAANGVEAGQSKAVIIPFDNHEALLKEPDGSYFINTQIGKATVTGSTATVVVKFNSAIDPTVLTATAINPFLISNLRRGYEIHLPGYAPTDKATASLFGTGDDNSVPSTGRYYLTKDNWPWAINFAQQFKYPSETTPITSAYLHFADWAASGGTLYPDWYINTASGYLNSALIFH